MDNIREWPTGRLKEIWEGGRKFFNKYTETEGDIEHIKYILNERLEIIKLLKKIKEWKSDQDDSGVNYD